MLDLFWKSTVELSVRFKWSFNFEICINIEEVEVWKYMP